MGHYKKIVFSARINGIERHLLSVRQREDFDLLLGPGTPVFFESFDRTPNEFSDQHYSIHRSNDGRDTTITQKTKLKNGTRHSIVSFVHNTDDHLLWLVYARRLPSLRNGTRILKAKKTDTVIQIADFDSSKECLFYSVFASRPTLDLSSLVSTGIQFYTATFDVFQLVIIPAYLNFPTIECGDVVGFTTSQMVTNDIFPPDHTRHDSESLPAAALVQLHWIYMMALRDLMGARLAELPGIDMLILNWFNEALFTGDK